MKWWVCVSLVLLVAVLLGPRVVRQKGEASATETGSQGQELRASNRSRDFSLQSSFPHDRLARLYARYPILAFEEDPFTSGGGHAFEELLSGIEDYALPRDLSLMWSRDEWDLAKAQQYLDENAALFERLAGICEWPVERQRLPDDLFFRFQDHRLRAIGNARRLLRFKQRHHLEAGELSKVKEANEVILSLAEHSAARSPSMVAASVAASVERSVFKDLLRFEEFPEIKPRLPMASLVADGFRGDFLFFLSSVEAAHRGDERSKEHFETMGVSEELQRVLRDEPRDELEEAFSEFSAAMVRGMNRAENAGRLIHYHTARGKVHEILSRYDFREREALEEAWILSVMTVETPYQQGIDHLHYQTKRAIHLAASNGVVVTELSDLVPDYISLIPVNPATNEPFSYDPDSGEVIVPTDLREMKVRNERYVGIVEYLEKMGIPVIR